jgi:hypothetical protein
MLLAIDPGEDAGWAIFDSKKLTACGLGEEPDLSGIVDRVVVELPKIYPGRKQKARPGDIVLLATRAGERGGPYRRRGITVDYFEPNEWKGGVPKEVSHSRAWALLNDSERDVIALAAKGIAPGKRHNMLDAVALGLFAVGRAKR